MHHLTIAGITVAALAGGVVLLTIGWGAGRAYQRAVDAWWRFRNHVRMTRFMYRSATRATADAVGTVALAVAVVVAASITAYLLIAK